MTEQDWSAVRILAMVVAFAGAVLWQRFSPHARVKGSLRVNGGLWLVNLVVVGSVCGACVCSAAVWAEQRGTGLLNLAHAPLWVALPLCVLALDLVSYLWHRANHLVPLLWRWHQVHHSDPAFTVSTSLRFHPGELLLSLPLRLATVVLLGAPLAAVVIFEIVFTLANAVEHGDIDVPARLEGLAALLLITPALHRWHHSLTAPERDRNFGTIFSFWDRLGGTYADSSSRVRVRTGLAGMGEPSLGEALAMPLRPPGQ